MRNNLCIILIRMSTQFHLPTTPGDAQEVNDRVAIVRSETHVAYFASGVPVFVHAPEDVVGQRVAAAQLMELGLAQQTELSAALDLDRSTLYRQHQKLTQAGVLGVVNGKRGPRGPHRLTPEKQREAAQLLGAGVSNRHVAQQLGVTEGAIRHARKRGLLSGDVPALGPPSLEGPSVRSRRAAQAAGGIAVARHTERALARLGLLTAAPPQFVPTESVRSGGALLALPALLALGLLEVGEQTYGALKNGFYGLRAMLLVLAFMALLRIRPPEQLQGHPPGELGRLLGLDRAPEVKTVRRKLWELAARGQASTFSRRLAERWVQEQRDSVGLLYVDGHVRPYHGDAQTLPEAWVARRRLCMPATTDLWVHQQDAQPLFVVTTPANDDLIAMLRREILPEVRRLVGDRRVTLVFDREGWSPDFFQDAHARGFDILTYRKGRYPLWPDQDFHEITGVIDGRSVTYELAEQPCELLPGFVLREIRRRCATGHQTALVTTRTDLPIEVLAYRMFERWTQENFFRYMRAHFALDALVTYAVEPADPTRTIPNPARKTLTAQIAAARTQLTEVEHRYGQAARRNREARCRTMRGFKVAHADLQRQMTALEAQIQTLTAERKALPKRVPVTTVVDEADVVRLAPEGKHLTDTIKMVAYRAETALVRALAPGYARTEEEGRALVREVLASNADLIPEPDQHRLRVRVHSLANPRSNEALAKLCETLTALSVCYPGTDLRLVYEPPTGA
jgi:hypothetical protein